MTKQATAAVRKSQGSKQGNATLKKKGKNKKPATKSGLKKALGF